MGNYGELAATFFLMYGDIGDIEVAIPSCQKWLSDIKQPNIVTMCYPLVISWYMLILLSSSINQNQASCKPA